MASPYQLLQLSHNSVPAWQGLYIRCSAQRICVTDLIEVIMIAMNAKTFAIRQKQKEIEEKNKWSRRGLDLKLWNGAMFLNVFDLKTFFRVWNYRAHGSLQSACDVFERLGGKKMLLDHFQEIINKMPPPGSGTPTPQESETEREDNEERDKGSDNDGPIAPSSSIRPAPLPSSVVHPPSPSLPLVATTTTTVASSQKRYADAMEIVDQEEVDLKRRRVLWQDALERDRIQWQDDMRRLALLLDPTMPVPEPMRASARFQFSARIGSAAMCLPSLSLPPFLSPTFNSNPEMNKNNEVAVI